MSEAQEPSKADEGQSRLTVGLADATYLPDYLWEVANPRNFGASTAVDKMNDIMLAFDPSTPARCDVENRHLARCIMDREQPSIHETIRRMMAANAELSGPEAGLSPEGRARTQGYASEDEK